MAAEPLNWSRAELSALLLKAGRGAGFPLAHAEDMARAVGRYGDGRAMEAVLRALGTPWTALAMKVTERRLIIESACAVQALPHVVDALTSGCEEALLRGLDEPCLLAAYLHGTDFAGHPMGEHWRVAQGPATLAVPAPQPITPEQIAELEIFAARTYVPASLTSREGAGQGADQD
ncbi:MAG: hypothetical protein AAGF78_06150 [Pseudomonadota bacterium]